MATLKISSPQNQHIKHIVALQQKSQLRREENLVVVEGLRELQHCSNAGHTLKQVYYCPTMINAEQLPANSDAQVIEVTSEVYEKIAYRGSTEGVIALVEPRHYSLSDIALGDSPLIAVLESLSLGE